MSKVFLVLLAIGSALGAGGCAENRPAAQTAAGAPAKRHAECLVCKHENDLACVDLEVDDKTPRTIINGQEYFFCSESCKKQCVKNPQRYLSGK